MKLFFKKEVSEIKVVGGDANNSRGITNTEFYDLYKKEKLTLDELCNYRELEH